jgi:hypothetical protein
MSGIVNRTVFVDNVDGIVKPHDWCRVTTGIGTMYEPRCELFLRPEDGTAMDFEDDIARVDRIDGKDLREPLVGGGTGVVTGGTQMPRVGR